LKTKKHHLSVGLSNEADLDKQDLVNDLKKNAIVHNGGAFMLKPFSGTEQKILEDIYKVNVCCNLTSDLFRLSTKKEVMLLP
jgi:hypothetical protein